jgi:ATP-dependent DNA helicase DinG
VQGEESNVELVQQLQSNAQAILLGTGSFWEGLDLGGIPLNAVIIDKLPFASPDDPVLQMRSHYLQEQGVDSFQAALIVFKHCYWQMQ